MNKKTRSSSYENCHSYFDDDEYMLKNDSSEEY